MEETKQNELDRMLDYRNDLVKLKQEMSSSAILALFDAELEVVDNNIKLITEEV